VTFSKQGPKRRRFTRRELPYGQRSMWGNTVVNFRREREVKTALADASDPPIRPYQYR